jgi:hypothetical protein
VLALVFLRAQSVSDAFSYLGRLLSWAQNGTRLNSPYLLPAILVVFLAHLLIGKDRNLVLELVEKPMAPRVLAYASLLVTLVLLSGSDTPPFIYVQF